MQQWLDDSEEAFVDQTVLFLRVIQRELPDRVAELVEPYVAKSEQWNNRLLHLAVWGDWSTGRRFLELMLRLIDEGILDDARGPIAVNSDFWSLVHELQYRHQSWGCEVAGHYFGRRRRLSLDAGQPNPFDHYKGTIPDSQSAERTLLELAQNAPEEFVLEIMPFMQAVIEDCVSHKTNGLLEDPVWSHRIFQSGYGIDHALLKAMEIALSRVAIQQPEMYRSMIEPFLDSPFETVQYLLIRSLASNGLEFANEGIDQLCKSPERLEIGYLSHSHWAARELIESVSPHCSDEKLKELETLLLGYYSEWEKSDLGRQQCGFAQFTLLGGIIADRRSIDVSTRLNELQEKFGVQEPASPKPMRAQGAQPPIPTDVLEEMTDEQWLAAIQQHDTDKHEFTQDGRLVGGALELSRVLEDRVKHEPERFVELVLKFPDHVNPFYFEAILRGMSEVNLDIETVMRVTERCHEIQGRPLGRYICDPIARSAQGNVPPEALDLVAWYATEDSDPEQELWQIEASPGQGYYYGGDMLNNGINTNRGRAAQALARLIEVDGNRIAYIQPALERMVQDPSLAVRSCVAQALIAVLRHDRDLAVELFQQLCDTEDALLQTPFIERFLSLALQTHFRELSDILEHMVTSKVPDVASAGGRQACLAALDLQEAAEIAGLCLSGSEAQKIGAAQVMAANVTVATCRSFCEEALIRLFNDPIDDVRAEAARCFLRFEGSQLEGYEDLITGFVHSDASSRDYFPLLVALERSTANIPDVTLLVCESFIDVAGLATADVSTRESGDASFVIKLTLRTYQQSSDKNIRTRCLDMIDRLMENGAYGINDALEEFER